MALWGWKSKEVHGTVGVEEQGSAWHCGGWTCHHKSEQHTSSVPSNIVNIDCSLREVIGKVGTPHRINTA
jgi:hypothetical protein